jgi:hypothetical protein
MNNALKKERVFFLCSYARRKTNFWDPCEQKSSRARNEKRRISLLVILLLMGGAAFAQPSSPLFSAFKQGIVKTQEKKAGNCASVAIIKAAIGTYGVGKVFQQQLGKNGLAVVLRDGAPVSLTPAELEMASAASAFVPGDTAQKELKEIFNYAQLCFAVLVKRYQGLTEPAIGSYSKAIADINGGYRTEEIYKLLGLKVLPLEENPSYQTLSTHANLLIWNTAHAVYYSKGYYDESGNRFPTAVEIEQLRKRHASFWGTLINGSKPRGGYSLLD